MLLGERSRRIFGSLLGAPQLELLLVQGRPFLVPVDQAPSRDECALCRDSRHIMRRGLVLLNHLLDAILGIASRADQIPFRVVDFVFIQFDLSLHQFQLVSQFVLFVSGGFGFCGGQLLHARFVGFQVFFCLLQLRLNLFGFLGKGGRMFLDVMQRLSERQVYFIIGNAQGILR